MIVEEEVVHRFNTVDWKDDMFLGFFLVCTF